jgi:hypothetical protein
LKKKKKIREKVEHTKCGEWVERDRLDIRAGPLNFFFSSFGRKQNTLVEGISFRGGGEEGRRMDGWKEGNWGLCVWQVLRDIRSQLGALSTRQKKGAKKEQ